MEIVAVAVEDPVNCGIRDLVQRFASQEVANLQKRVLPCGRVNNRSARPARFELI
jgi:hypothetical protein